MSVTFAIATEADAAAIAAVRLAAARDLTARFGTGTWSFAAESAQGVRDEMQLSTLLFARDGGVVLGTLSLSRRNPWLGDISFFTRCARPIYLTSMAVDPKRQRSGLGRRLLAEARRVARDILHGEAIRLDSYDAAAGAGEFYRKCGFREVHRGGYNGTPLLWFETML